MQVEIPKSGDLYAIASLDHEAWCLAHGPLLSEGTLSELGFSTLRRRWRKTLRSSASETRVTRVEGRIVGVSTLGRCGDPDLDPEAGDREVSSIAVAPALHRQGIGRGLLTALLEESGASTVYAWVVVGNRLGEKFFEGTGFEREIDREKDFPFMGNRLRVARYRRRNG